MLRVNGISLHVEDHGRGKPVLLLHGWPDSAYLWRNQIPFLTANGFRAIAPDLRGFGRSDRPAGVAAYSLQNAVGDAVGILDAFGIGAADIVGHDWGAAVAWFTATAGRCCGSCSEATGMSIVTSRICHGQAL
jgi:pimeloyl-ACP methyl ester carboxylesterase